MKAKEEAEDLTQEMAELRYQMNTLLEEEQKRRACIEQASLQRIAELEAQVLNFILIKLSIVTVIINIFDCFRKRLNFTIWNTGFAFLHQDPERTEEILHWWCSFKWSREDHLWKLSCLLCLEVVEVCFMITFLLSSLVWNALWLKCLLYRCARSPMCNLKNTLILASIFITFDAVGSNGIYLYTSLCLLFLFFSSSLDMGT